MVFPYRLRPANASIRVQACPSSRLKSDFGQFGYDQTLNHGMGNQRIVGQLRQHRVALVTAKGFDPGGLVRVEVILVNDDRQRPSESVGTEPQPAPGRGAPRAWAP